MIAFRHVCSATLLLSLSGMVAAAPWGIGRAKDGDSLMVGDVEVRLYGIDAPEADQTCRRGGQEWSCGAAAAQQLSKFVTGRDVRCETVGKDQYGRVLGRCMVGETDINRALVAMGYAVAFRRYSSDYVSAEDSAKANRRGVWSGTFEMPSDYRHAEDTPIAVRPKQSSSSTPRVSSIASSGCNIKGNRNRKGQWIYHVPGMPYYDQTRPEEIFCTEAEARAAGYRRAIVR